LFTFTTSYVHGTHFKKMYKLKELGKSFNTYKNVLLAIESR
jgi:hypothetical protein